MNNRKICIYYNSTPYGEFCTKNGNGEIINEEGKTYCENCSEITLSNEEVIPVRILRLKDVPIPQYAKIGDAGFDLVAAEDVVIEPGETKIVPTGLKVELPFGYELQIRPRSGLSSRSKLRIGNAPGTIDSNYRGEIGIIVDNTHTPESSYCEVKGYTYDIKRNKVNELYEQYEHNTYLIRKGDRIAQGVINRVPTAIFIEVDELSETDRGEGGFGSTGYKT